MKLLQLEFRSVLYPKEFVPLL